MKLYLKTFGCRANQYDTESLRGIALANGASIVDRAADADYAVFNSCAVTAEAEADLRQAIRRARRQNPEIRSLVLGCASALELRSARSGRARPHADIRSLSGVEEIFDGADVTGVAAALGFKAPSGDLPTLQSGARGLLRIQDGCDEHCTFCATRVARGASSSRSVDELIDEAARLAAGHPEIVLTGVHIGSYGADIGSSLSSLVGRLIERVPHARFRLSSLEATEVDEHLVEIFATRPRRLASYLHAPLQSGSDRVLKRMGRHWYTRQRYVEAVQRIAGRVATLGLGADVIAGFPGESEADHSETMAVVRDLPFTSLHVFPYSVRAGTAAERLPERVVSDVIARRASELRELAREKADSWRKRRNGEPADVVVTTVRGGTDGGASQVSRAGLTEDYLTVDVDDASLARGARFDATLSLAGERLIAIPIRR